MAKKEYPKVVVKVDTTELNEAIEKLQKLLDMLYEADNLAPGILQRDETIED